MVLTCPECHKKHIINSSTIPSHVKKVRCKFCSHGFALRHGSSKTGQAISAGPRKQTRKIAVTLTKGGVGKTTTAVNLAASLALASHRVLLVDTDTQGQAGFILGIKPRFGIADVLTEKIMPEKALYEARKNLWLLAGGKALAGINRLINRKDFGGEWTLAESLKKLAGQFDFIILDTSPGWDTLTINVLFFANEILAPVSVEVMTMEGLVEFTENLAAIRKYRPCLALHYIVPTFMDKRVKKNAVIMEKLSELYGDKLCTPIRYNTKLSESPGFGQTIFEYAEGSKGAEDYRELAGKIVSSGSAKTTAGNQ